jgi:hypothetical protein
MALSGAAPHAYTARYHGSGAEAADESGLATALAERHGAKLTLVDVGPQLADMMEPIIRALDEPHADEIGNGFLRDHLRRRRNRESVLWALLAFSIWHRLYLEPRSIAPVSPESSGAYMVR